ncbi:hypothetical protein [Azohydromonas caseinilytica]|uniref:Aminoglycoside phosphotransferase family enzyme n=1 Tax=Azohydromonas caseinilytica TaxID=2728836 RepID=A0A848FDB4_9BURK|nr:hypothetical protein [Azohydromonas caseinilytica]NML18197.1 hypothetical protein [Azohydromonas caseinilytica]
MAGACEDLPDLARKLRFLQSAAAHGGRSDPVELIETHMSWVVLCGDRVLKLKKPVRYAFLDFSTPEARSRNAWEELRLNRRLAPQVYEGVLALQWRGGELLLAPGEHPHPDAVTLDWLVLMRRLPAQRMLDHLVKQALVQQPDIDRLADVLAAFYRDAVPVPLSGGDYLERIHEEQRNNRAVLTMARFGDIDPAGVLDLYEAALARQAPALARRADGGHIVDGHGDLRPEHVCLLERPVIIDALEFQARMREVDPYDEIAFLGLECAVAGAPWIGERLWTRLAQALGGAPPPVLHGLYTARRAVLRARLSVAHLLDAQPRTPEVWLPRGQGYLARARRALQRLQEA